MNKMGKNALKGTMKFSFFSSPALTEIQYHRIPKKEIKLNGAYPWPLEFCALFIHEVWEIRIHSAWCTETNVSALFIS